MIRLTRTFHPVGQGAFYSELFLPHPNMEFLTIYDCGTDLRNSKLGTPAQIKSNLESRINQDLGSPNATTGKHAVQLLFLSHFDEDHVSGVHTLEPKVVVIPLATKEEITYYQILDVLQIAKINWNLLLNPKLFFGNGAIVIGVKADDEDDHINNERYEIEISEEGGIPNLNRNALNSTNSHVDMVVPSGSALYLKSYWQYIVFNPKISKLEKFKTALTQEGWNWDTLTDELKSNLNEKKIKDLRDIYKQVSSDLNSTSLLVYSGPIHKIRHIAFQSQKIGNISYLGCHMCPNWDKCIDFEFCEEFNNRIACMYFGDWKISETKLSKYYAQLPGNGAQIGTVQIPHHGSEYNHGHLALKNLKNHQYIKSIISCGDNNRFNHPSNKIISEIMDLEGEIVLVTDNCSSSFITKYYFR